MSTDWVPNMPIQWGLGFDRTSRIVNTLTKYPWRGDSCTRWVVIPKTVCRLPKSEYTGKNSNGQTTQHWTSPRLSIALSPWKSKQNLSTEVTAIRLAIRVQPPAVGKKTDRWAHTLIKLNVTGRTDFKIEGERFDCDSGKCINYFRNGWLWKSWPWKSRNDIFASDSRIKTRGTVTISPYGTDIE